MPRAFIPNPGFSLEIEDGEKFKDGAQQIGEQVKSNAETFGRSVGAPWVPRKDHQPIEVGEDSEGVFVANTDHVGHLVEWGSYRTPPYGLLRRAAQAAGLRVDESP